MEHWIAWTRPSRSRTGSENVIVRLESEGKPRNFNYSRSATPEEIAEEKQKRAERERESIVRREFESRADYQDAIAVRNALEWMSPTNHPLGKLTKHEWAQIRKRLTE